MGSLSKSKMMINHDLLGCPIFSQKPFKQQFGTIQSATMALWEASMFAWGNIGNGMMSVGLPFEHDYLFQS